MIAAVQRLGPVGQMGLLVLPSSSSGFTTLFNCDLSEYSLGAFDECFPEPGPVVREHGVDVYTFGMTVEPPPPGGGSGGSSGSSPPDKPGP